MLRGVSGARSGPRVARIETRGEPSAGAVLHQPIAERRRRRRLPRAFPAHAVHPRAPELPDASGRPRGAPRHRVGVPGDATAAVHHVPHPRLQRVEFKPPRSESIRGEFVHAALLARIHVVEPREHRADFRPLVPVRVRPFRLHPEHRTFTRELEPLREQTEALGLAERPGRGSNPRIFNLPPGELTAQPVLPPEHAPVQEHRAVVRVRVRQRALLQRTLLRPVPPRDESFQRQQSVAHHRRLLRRELVLAPGGHDRPTPNPKYLTPRHAREVPGRLGTNGAAH